jgi:hypothetical protein
MRPIAQALLSRKKPLFTMTLFFGNKKGGQMGRLIFTLYLYIYYLKLKGVNVTWFREIYFDSVQSFTGN